MFRSGVSLTHPPELLHPCAGTFADLFQRLLAEDVLCLAGILSGGLFVHAQLHEEVGEQTMAAVDAFCDLTARLQQGQVASPSTAI